MERRQHLDQLQDARIAVGQQAVVADDFLAEFTMKVCDSVGDDSVGDGTVPQLAGADRRTMQQRLPPRPKRQLHCGDRENRLRVETDSGTARTPADPDVLCQVTCPLSMFIKCKKGCLDCPPQKQRSAHSRDASAKESPLAPEDLPPIDDDWYLL